MAEPTDSEKALAGELYQAVVDAIHEGCERRTCRDAIAQCLAAARAYALESVLDVLAHDPDQSRQGQAALVRVIGRVLVLRDGRKPPTIPDVLDFCEERRKRKEQSRG